MFLTALQRDLSTIKFLSCKDKLPNKEAKLTITSNNRHKISAIFIVDFTAEDFGGKYWKVTKEKYI